MSISPDRSQCLGASGFERQHIFPPAMSFPVSQSLIRKLFAQRRSDDTNGTSISENL